MAATTLQKWAQRGLVPFDVTAGGHRRFDLEELRRALRHGLAPADLDRLRRLRRDIDGAVRRHGFANIRVVGSVARGEQRPGSDVDLLVDAGPDATLLDVMAAEAELEGILGVEIDLITSGAASGDMSDVVRDAIAL